MSNVAGWEADAASLCSLPVKRERKWHYLYFLDGWSQRGGRGCRISCRRETKERLSWSEGAAICDRANLHSEHTWPIAYTVLSSLTRDGTPIRGQAHAHTCTHKRAQSASDPACSFNADIWMKGQQVPVVGPCLCARVKEEKTLSDVASI